MHAQHEKFIEYGFLQVSGNSCRIHVTLRKGRHLCLVKMAKQLKSDLDSDECCIVCDNRPVPLYHMKASS
jgi:hypothetical protein